MKKIRSWQLGSMNSSGQFPIFHAFLGLYEVLCYIMDKLGFVYCASGVGGLMGLKGFSMIDGYLHVGGRRALECP